MRTNTCGELRVTNVNQIVTLTGWCSKKRDLGGVIFIDLRDRYGITQLVVNPGHPDYQTALNIKNEYVIKTTGKVINRQSVNNQIPTGEIEIEVLTLTILSEALLPPLLIQDQTDALEETRMRYRYLDLRRPVMQNNLILRHKTCMVTRNYFDQLNFIEVETPMLGKSTPEGARDFLVPSRVHPGSFFALPQSPQIYKQLLMVSGLDRYFQIVKCFRDEDLRADRQLEFTQIDVEMSFVDEEDIYLVVEGLMKKIWKEVLDMEITTPFIRIDYQDAMNRYGSDKPDLRYQMELIDLSDYFKTIGNPYLDSIYQKGGVVKAIVVKGGASAYSRKEIDRLTLLAKKYHAQGLTWLKYDQSAFTGPISKNINSELASTLVTDLGLTNTDLILMVGDQLENCNFALGALRQTVAKELNLIDESQFAFAWVVNWPLFEYSSEEQRYMAAHHPFTAPKAGHEDLMLTDPSKVLAKAYDIVLNGYELGGGSIRIHNQELQQRMFEVLGLSSEQINTQFSFFNDALKYGTPPHGGFALGLDRLVMIITKNNNLREVIAFPKTANAKCLMSDAPTEVALSQLKELKIKVEE